MSAVLLNVRVDKEVKAAAEELFADFGMSMTTAINVFLRQAIRSQALPFMVSREIPNAETIAAMEEGERIAHDPKAKGYDNVDEMLRELKEG